ncbi:MAG: DUF3365 domain-containing protein [Cyclobacteriaceae bacterium]|nr:DUF3365 domain-containing protein [Cyclobacteriaceae bacterium]
MRPVRLMLVSLAALIFVVISCLKRPAEKTDAATLPDSVYLKLGDQLVTLTFDTLRDALTTAIGQQGFAYAVSFCNEKAYPLTTYYQEEGITIRRASDKYRNPQNIADSLESALLDQFRTAGPATRIVRTENEIHYIKPILVQGMCLHCHGTPGVEIKPETLIAIAQKYQTDKATGYKEGDLRGLWHVVFSKNKKH